MPLGRAPGARAWSGWSGGRCSSGWPFDRRGAPREIRDRDRDASLGDRLDGQRDERAPGDGFVDVDGRLAPGLDRGQEIVQDEEIAAAVPGLAGLLAPLSP